MLEIFYLHHWPDDARFPMLGLAKELGARCRLRIRNKDFEDAFEAVLAAMCGPKSMPAHRQSLRAAVEAAALFHGDLVDAAAKRINDRLAEVGGAKMNHPSLAKQIREMASTAAGQTSSSTPTPPPRHFLGHLAEAGEVDDGQPMLRYYPGRLLCLDRQGMDVARRTKTSRPR